MIGYIRKQADDNEDWAELLDAKTGIPILLDTTWTDVFWKQRSTSNRIDEIYYAFLNRFFWNELFTTVRDDDNATEENRKKPYLLSVGNGKALDGSDSNTVENNNPSYGYLNKDAYTDYRGIDPYRYYDGEIPLQLFADLRTVLNNYASYSASLPEIKWIEDFEFIPKYEKDGNTPEDIQITGLSQLQRIIFFAVCKYFKERKEETDDTSLKRWLRVVRNLISGESEDGRPQIRSTQAVRTAIEYIDRLRSHDVYASLASKEIKDGVSTDIEKRWNEEIEKARQIMDGNQLRPYNGTLQKKGDSKNEINYVNWEDVIADAEDWAFFKGAIRFLFHNEKGQEDWSCFDNKWGNARKYFKKESKDSESALNPDYDNAKLLKVLISRFDNNNFWNQLWWNHHTFNNLPRTWLYYLLNSQLTAPVHCLLSGEMEIKPLPPSDDEAWNMLYQLSNTSLLDYIVQQRNNAKYWIRNNYKGHKAIYPSGWGIFLDASDRDDFLLHKKIVDVDPNAVIGEREFLNGPDVCFKYEGHNYLWDSSDDIYLLQDSESWDNWERVVRKDSEDKSYHFHYQKDLDEETMKNEFKRIYQESLSEN